VVIKSKEAVVLIEKRRALYGSDVKVYIRGDVKTDLPVWGRKDGAKVRLEQAGINSRSISAGQKMILWFDVAGEVFVTSEAVEKADVGSFSIFAEAREAFEQIPDYPEFVVQKGSLVPPVSAYQPIELKVEQTKPEKAKTAEPVKQKVAVEKPKKPAAKKEPAAKIKRYEAKEAPVGIVTEQIHPETYPVNIAAAGEVEPSIESVRLADGNSVATVIGRFYLWQRQGAEGVLLELQADNAVIYYSGEPALPNRGGPEQENETLFAGTSVWGIYLLGDVMMRRGQRVIRADEMFYDFRRKKAIAINGVMRNFDVGRGIPIYVRARQLRQTAENQFYAEDVILTSSEFYRPQISLNASKIIFTDTTPVDELAGKVGDSSYDARIYDLRMKLDDMTIFYWPYLRSDLERPDVPIKSARTSRDSTWGTTLETRWYFARLLGLHQPEGTDSTLALDYYEKRGIGVGGEITYSRGNYYGRTLGYIINDTGKDDLGRHYSRRNIEPPDNLRGRFSWIHRHFLPYNWQLTTEIGYASDENFIEGYYRGEYNVGTQESYVHMKRIEENWGISLLAKGRINSFSDELEELPSGEFHLTGQSIYDDKFTLYSDTEISRRRQRIGDKHTIQIDENFFSYTSHRTEIDMPVRAGDMKLVPFAAGTFGYDDRSGFTRSLVDGSNTGRFGEDKVWYGELGVRLSGQPVWKTYPEVESRLWDLNGIRHIIKPYAAAVAYKENDSVIKQRDTATVGISQRLQTKRGPEGNQRAVDWMRLDMDVVWVSDSVSATDAGPGPDKFLWSKPIVPLKVFSSPGIYGGDLLDSLHRFGLYGPRRNYLSADYFWCVSDTSALFSDINFDIQSGVVQEFNVGLSRLRWPNLSYYIGSRYLRRINVLDEKGSNALTFSATYKIDPRYTAVFSQQYDFDYEASIRSDISLIRKYHRVFMALTYSADESIKRHAIVFSVWPEGVSELAIGERGYMSLGGASGY
jgi:lipopolysaccharide assembly outer membrane protein LptD (OstA)